MDGNPNPKTKIWRGQICSETRFYVNSWLEKELPQVFGEVINIGAGGSPVPKSLLNFSKVTKYSTFDKEFYGSNRNPVDVFGDIQDMPSEWSGKWDSVLCIEVMECVPNPFKAMEEVHRILKTNGTVLITCPFNYRFFGEGSWEPKIPNEVKDFWRPTRDGWKLLTQQFSSVEINGFGGTGEHDRFVYCIKATK